MLFFFGRFDSDLLRSTFDAYDLFRSGLDFFLSKIVLLLC